MAADANGAALTEVSRWTNHGGVLSVHDHESTACGCTMRFAVYIPPGVSADKPAPVLWYLSGLTCTWANVMEKSGIQRAAAEHGIIVVAPDTSPRGEAVPDDEAYDLGQGAGFYLTATEDPWSTHFRMDRYIVDELPDIIAANFPADLSRQGITGHSMGGHGAITLHLKHPERYRSVSAFSPITSPMQVPWGKKAFMEYLGEDQSAWAQYDASQLVAQRASQAHILIDTGDADGFLDEQLQPQIFRDACQAAGQSLESRLQPGYDHSYYFIASFVDDHLAHHARVLKG